MTKNEIAVEVSAKTGVEKHQCKAVIDALTETIIQANSRGEGVFIRGFGSMVPVKTKPKIARNIKAGTKLQIPESYKPKFVPSKEFKEQVNYTNHRLAEDKKASKGI